MSHVSVTPVIPKYTMLHKLGEGAMAEVWLGEHERNGRKAAIKILKPAALSDADAEKLFLREGAVLAGFDHPNIVRIYDNDRVGDIAYIAMEVLSGGTLLERMQRAPIRVGEALGLVVQIANALEVAHRQQVIHRDLKPANIMLRDETTPVITDFGAVRLLGRSSVYAASGSIIGTPIYMSPEQITGQTLTGASDLYALGVIFHELLTGRLPFPGGSVNEIGMQHLYAPIPRLPDALMMLQPVIEQLLAKKPDQRYGSAQAFVGALRQVYLDNEALRRQAGFAGTNMAWSSQLRALGFVLDVHQKEAVRIAQGAFAARAPAAVVDSPAPAAAPTVSPTAPKPSSPVPAPRPQTVPASASAVPATGYSRWLWPGVGMLVVAVVLSTRALWWPEAPEAIDPPVTSDKQTALAPAISFREVLAARDAYIALTAEIVELERGQSLDLKSARAAAENRAQQGTRALDEQQLHVALSAFGDASGELRTAAIQQLADLEAQIAKQAQAALDKKQLEAVEKLLADGKAVAKLRAEWEGRQ